MLENIHTAEHIPFTAYSAPVEVTPIAGAQSSIEIGLWEDIHPAIKKIPRWSLSYEEAEHIMVNYFQYRSVLSDNAVFIPQSYYINILSLGDNTFTLCVVEEFISSPTIEGFLQNGYVPEHVWFRLLNLGLNLYSLQNKIYIDMKPDNFIYDTELDDVVLIDLIPPMVANDEGNISGYYPAIYGTRLKEHMHFNFGTLQGQITKLLALIKFQKPNLYGYLKKLTLEYLNTRLSGSVYDYLAEQSAKDFSDQNFLYSGNTKEDKLELLKRVSKL